MRALGIRGYWIGHTTRRTVAGNRRGFDLVCVWISIPFTALEPSPVPPIYLTDGYYFSFGSVPPTCIHSSQVHRPTGVLLIPQPCSLRFPGRQLTVCTVTNKPRVHVRYVRYARHMNSSKGLRGKGAARCMETPSSRAPRAPPTSPRRRNASLRFGPTPRPRHLLSGRAHVPSSHEPEVAPGAYLGLITNEGAHVAQGGWV